MSQPDVETESEDEETQETEGEASERPDEQPRSDAQQRRLAAKEAKRQARAVEEERERAAAVETVHLKIFRYDPEVPSKQTPRFDDFHVPMKKGLTVLDAIIYARDTFDSSLTVRHSCRQAVCGSDAVFINGRQRLACKTQVKDLDQPIRVEPLPHYDVIKDLVVDMEHFYDQMARVEPYFQPDEPPSPREEYRQSRENREKIKMSTRCIWCGACTSSCNIVAGDQAFLGPAAINKGYRFYMDEREGAQAQKHRLEILQQEQGVWRCQTQFSCTTVCPKDIPLTEHIQALKRESVKQNLRFW
jgi:succinate dehydrogenase / fumarate reductase iron-sulfur subunit